MLLNFVIASTLFAVSIAQNGALDDEANTKTKAQAQQPTDAKTDQTPATVPATAATQIPKPEAETPTTANTEATVNTQTKGKTEATTQANSAATTQNTVDTQNTGTTVWWTPETTKWWTPDPSNTWYTPPSTSGDQSTHSEPRSGSASGSDLVLSTITSGSVTTLVTLSKTGSEFRTVQQKTNGTNNAIILESGNRMAHIYVPIALAAGLVLL